jgi:hypothetical protein
MRYLSIALVLALLGIVHAPRIRTMAQGTLPCYTSTGPCGSTFHVDKDHGAVTLAADCSPGQECTFTSDVLLSLSEQFSNTTYSCQANQTGVVTYQVVFEAYPLEINKFELTFRNETGGVIYGGTVFNHSFFCEGI